MKQLILLLAVILGGGLALKLLSKRMRSNQEISEAEEDFTEI